ncbi:hypothetical protein T552_00973 [Pneumocystis carinii B80]|uniref:Inositol polyphosphate-related phosphatase domain-containing protein n=1 Tax=Pneumocystis carinii (strain B80) TaxID=1408658 RepID=A0A0W4ZN69_PNEC8|nr:hypothetical protein T552_00973 [Pneumocystis carinii B80]KTW29766.1 hypothetical protein T552_00973 [Pneumocystis carinii B80]
MGIIEEEKRVSRLKEKFERLAIEQRCSESYGPSGGRERYVKTMPAYYRSYERTIESPGEKMKYERSYIKVSNKDKRSEIRSSSYFKSSLKNPYHIENIFDDENDITIPEINEESMNADRSPSNAAIKSFNDTASYHSDIFREDRYMDSSRYKNDTNNELDITTRSCSPSIPVKIQCKRQKEYHNDPYFDDFAVEHNESFLSSKIDDYIFENQNILPDMTSSPFDDPINSSFDNISIKKPLLSHEYTDPMIDDFFHDDNMSSIAASEFSEETSSKASKHDKYIDINNIEIPNKPSMSQSKLSKSISPSRNAPSIPPKPNNISKAQTNKPFNFTEKPLKPKKDFIDRHNLFQGHLKSYSMSTRLPGGESFSYPPTNFHYSSVSLTSTVINETKSDIEEKTVKCPENQPTTDYPDSSQTNRRRPIFKNGPLEIRGRSEIKYFLVSGDYLCSCGTIIKVWNIKTGEHIWSLPCNDMKITSMSFVPCRNVDEEGTRIWLGTKDGHILEINIFYQGFVDKRFGIHSHPIIFMLRCGYELWTLDDSGKLLIWSDDTHKNGLHLQSTPRAYKVVAKASFCFVVKNQLWLGVSRSVYVYNPLAYVNKLPFITTNRPIVPHLPVGEISCGTFLRDQPDLVYLGHQDGKISVYSISSLTCLDVINVSLYNIVSLIGVGNYLWAAFKTGMIYVYDLQSKPRKVMKGWWAHKFPILKLQLDTTSIWKVKRCQVVSLASDNIIRIWDGLLMEDWLENEMHRRDEEFCKFRDINITVCTWNAGASKPNDLNSSTDDFSFFEKVLKSPNPPEIIVFGFQELVDLENKRLTAKHLMKFNKKKDPKQLQEHMSCQYSAWKDRLSNEIVTYLHSEFQYSLLHSENLVGLFTCIFTKTSIKPNIKKLNSVQVKTGLGGLHGNKGALVVRFILDDTSLCFINCHLAAGKSQVVDRNNHLATILESSDFPPELDNSKRADLFVGGGDGSMILDHEICILNGDLNYRIDMRRDTILEHIRNKDYQSLFEKDQLILQRKKNPGFRLRLFSEAEINFPPTYKYDIGTDEYDTSEKKRSPAWCDRIFYRGDSRMKCTSYRQLNVRISDHRPVVATFSIKVKTIDPVKKKDIWKIVATDWMNIAQKFRELAKLDYLVSECGFEEELASKILNNHNGEVPNALTELLNSTCKS